MPRHGSLLVEYGELKALLQELQELQQPLVQAWLDNKTRPSCASARRSIATIDCCIGEFLLSDELKVNLKS